MDNKETWIKNKTDRIEKLTEELPISKYNFLKISFLNRMVEQSALKSDSCKTCLSNLSVLEQTIEMLPDPTPKGQLTMYENNFNTIREHFYKSHGFSSPNKYTALLALLFGFSGLIAGLIVSLIIFSKISGDILLMGLTAGLLAGYFTGSAKDGKLNREKKTI